jgi:Zn-dependent protease with chaperone function
VVAVSLKHIAAGHTLKKLVKTIAIYAATALVVFVFRRNLVRARPVLDVLVIFAPLGAFYFLSRQNEYEADRKEVEFTGNPEIAIRALYGIHALSAAPTRSSLLAQIFATHPSFEKRAWAMGRAADMPSERIAEILSREEFR